MNEKKITIKGTPPAWDQAEFERRVADWINVYRGTEQSMELVRANFEHDLLLAVIDKSKQGYTVSTSKRVYHAELDHSVWMVKPESQQADDIVAIKVKVKSEYVEWLESERTRFQGLLREQLIQAAHEKELKAQREKEEKQLVEIETQVQGCYKTLVIPD